jgi:hypothetical protein
MLPRLGGSVLTWIRSHRTWSPEHCLQYVRTAFNVDPKYASAIDAWTGAEHKHHGDPTPPPAVPVFFAGGRYGHIAVSAGAGNCWSTDQPHAGSVAKVGIADLARAWGKTYVGWSEDLNGQRVWSAPDLDLSRLQKAATSPHEQVAPVMVRKVQRALGMRIRTGRWAKGTRRRWRALYPGSQGLPTVSSVADFAVRHGLTYQP